MRAPEGFQMRAVENHRRLFRERRGALYERGTRRKEHVFDFRYFFLRQNESQKYTRESKNVARRCDVAAFSTSTLYGVPKVVMVP